MEFYGDFLRIMPLWTVFVFTILVVLISVILGYRIGNYTYRKSKGEKQSSTGSIVGASLGLLAFMLAFTFSIAADRFNQRKQILLDQVNIIGTTYLRAEMLPDPPRNEIRKILRDYVDLAASLANKDYWTKPGRLNQLIDRTEDMQDQLWIYTVDLGREYRDSEVVSLFISSLNDLIDIQTTRVVVAIQYRIPGTIWTTLYLLSILVFGLVGYEIGISRSGNMLVSIIMAVIFSAVILLISDLDRPAQGQIGVSQQPMIELQQKMQKDVD